MSGKLWIFSFAGQNLVTKIVKIAFLKSRLRYLPNWTSLSLNDTLVSAVDFENLSKMVALSKLGFLQLRRVTEMAWGDHQSSFLVCISSTLPRLHYLSLETQEQRDTVVEFRLRLLPQLTSLNTFTDRGTYWTSSLCRKTYSLEKTIKRDIRIYRWYIIQYTLWILPRFNLAQFE